MYKEFDVGITDVEPSLRQEANAFGKFSSSWRANRVQASLHSPPVAEIAARGEPDNLS